LRALFSHNAPRKHRFLQGLVVVIVAWMSLAQTDALDTATDTSPGRGLINIIFVSENSSYSFDLDRFTPMADSCVDLFVNFHKIPNARACFSFHRGRKWQFENIGYNDEANHRGSIKVNVMSDGKGQFVKGIIIVSAKNDSLPTITNNITRRGDMPIVGDSTKPFYFSFERKVFLCKPPIEPKVEERKFIYPVSYMRREPDRLNYPELSMFHYGPSVRMPDIGSLNTRFFMMDYWHILHPDELEYNIPKKGN
jgi:hypothetical protein